MSAALPKDQTVNAYDKRATSYETKWQAYLEHTHDVFLNRIETSKNDSILDVSGGTGLLAEMMIDEHYPFQQLIINDPSERMLNIARPRLAGELNISFTNYRAEEINFDENIFDQIFCLNSFHFYTRQQHVLDRCYRMLEPGGKFYVLDWNRAGFFHITNTLIKLLASDHIDTRSLADFKKMLQKSGFTINKTDHWNWRYWKFFFAEAEKPV